VNSRRVHLKGHAERSGLKGCMSGEKQKRKVGASKSGKRVERAKAEGWEGRGVDGQGVVKGRGEG
jgi:hypothetical protein